MMKKQTSFKWTGRFDTQESGVSTRWHQHVREFTADSRGGCALIGFPVDEGVRRNAGRPGAAPRMRFSRTVSAGTMRRPCGTMASPALAAE